jgi:putative methyltransferase (TIGR04325 family)
MTDYDFNIWEGVYENWDKVPADEGFFESDLWVNAISGPAQNLLESYQTSASTSPVATTRDYILPVVASMVEREAGEILRILDFGGGLAASYFPIITAFSEPNNVEFHIIEAEAVCAHGKKIFSEQPNIHFHSKLPELQDPVHIIHSGSGLQYIKEWKSLIASFAEYKPQYFLLADMMAGDIKTFITIQNYYGKKIRSRFLNIKELLSVLREAGFRLIYKSKYLKETLGVMGPLPMENFEKENRLKHASQILLRWEGKDGASSSVA